MSIYYVGIKKNKGKRLPQLYYRKMKTCYDPCFIGIEVASTTLVLVQYNTIPSMLAYSRRWDCPPPPPPPAVFPAHISSSRPRDLYARNRIRLCGHSLRRWRDSCARGTFLAGEPPSEATENPICHISYKF